MGTRTSGFALIEIMIATPIVLIALGMLVQMLSSGTGLRENARENAVASTAAQSTIERMRNEDFRQLLVLYNADPLDDPGGPGTAPGHLFEVEGLDAVAPGVPVGELVLPTFNAGSEVAPLWEVREDLAQAELGTPRDLNGDSVIDGRDHGLDYTVLPVQIVLRWKGRLGARELRVVTVLTELYE